jgi:hypothetical protein
MIHGKKILVTASMVATALLTACTGNPRLPLFTTNADSHTLVCPEGTFAYCERMSAFVWESCDCVTVGR